MCYNCVDRHVEAGNGNKVAFYWEGEPAETHRAISYADLQREVTEFANTLKKLGGGKGAPVAIYMGTGPTAGGGGAGLVDTWWQTETGMIMISPLPGASTLKPGSAGRPLPGVNAKIYDEAGNEVGPGGGGYLVITEPWPAMLRGVFNDPQRYQETYWSKYPGVYFVGDGARIDRDGDFWLLGRVDDVMNVSGHRISTIEV